ncbi:ATPase RavA [Planctomycetes bacterium Poly30]|uniref:ATPase RavA n=1 Tax=Saltatorellus ferox TaxID=2528018 RepID=A0A518EWR0_9BACT|nr:ATPase RavA [Planctomycetes bacterium Poly30]
MGAATAGNAELEAEIQRASAWTSELTDAMQTVLVGQKDLTRSLLIGLLSSGHILLEGVPGLAKSLAVAALARGVKASFARLQFTPDLLPSDLVGTEIYDAKQGTFTVRKGPIFANFVLADEINRAPAKVQSALLEGMQERQVSIGGETFDLPRPFLVLATQNPLEQEGTYPLPEAQLDRFALKVVLDYPTRDEELQILDMMARTQAPEPVREVISVDAIMEARKLVDRITIAPPLASYIVAIVEATRAPKQHGLPELEHLIQFGGSPRATIWLALCARASAFLAGRAYARPEDVKAVAVEVLRHRIVPTYEAEAEGVTSDEIIRRVLERVPLDR